MPRSTKSTSNRDTTARTTEKRTAKGKPKATSAPRRSPPPTDEAIRRRAFEKYEARAGNGSASDAQRQVEDWLEAEAELGAKARKR